MTYKEYKELEDSYILKVMSVDGIEFNDDFPEEELEQMQVVEIRQHNWGCASVVLDGTIK